MRELKVFCGLLMIKGVQHRAIVATTSEKKAGELTHVGLSHIRNYWSKTGNKKALEIALPNPDKVFIMEGQPYHDGKYYESAMINWQWEKVK